MYSNLNPNPNPNQAAQAVNLQQEVYTLGSSNRSPSKTIAGHPEIFTGFVNGFHQLLITTHEPLMNESRARLYPSPSPNADQAAQAVASQQELRCGYS